jgi:PST family polysaccharide transporter
MAADSRAVSLRRVVRNFSILSVAEAVRVGLSGLATIYLARTLGAEAFGIYGFALALLTYLTTVVDGGLTVFGTREIAQDPSRLQQQLRVITSLRLLLAMLALGVLVVFVVLLDKPALVKQVVLLTAFSLLADALLLDWVFYALERAEFVALASVLNTSVFAGAVFTLIHASEQVWLTPLLDAAGGSAATLLLASVFVARFGFILPSVDLRAWRDVFVQALPIGLSHIMRAVNYSFSVILLGFMLNETAVGYFVGAQKLVFFVLGFGTLYMYAYLPSISNSFREGVPAMQRLLSRSMRLTAMFTLPMALGTVILAPQLIGLVYGATYANSVQPLQLLIWSVPLVVLSGHFRPALIAANLQRLDLLWVTLSAATNVALNLFLIPSLGSAGAALAMVTAEAVLLLLGYVSIARRIAALTLFRDLPRPLLAAGLMAVAVSLVQNFGVAIAIAVGGLVYFAVLFLLGEIQPRQVVGLFH